jgi:hypothetical protein
MIRGWGTVMRYRKGIHLLPVNKYMLIYQYMIPLLPDIGTIRLIVTVASCYLYC